MSRVVHTPAGQEVMGRLAESGMERAMEMKGREAGFACGSVQKDLRLVAGGQKIAGAAETAKSFVVHQPR